MKSVFRLACIIFGLALLTACGSRVEVPPAHVAKIMTKDGYQEALISSSKFRLPPCLMYCDRLVLLDTSDKAKKERLQIFIPEDKLNLDLGVQVTLSLDQTKTESLFNTLAPVEVTEDVSKIDWDTIYVTYAQQIVLTETREYMSKFSIAEIASSLERVNIDLRDLLSKRIAEKTPFQVRFVGVTEIRYPEIITKAQENAAERRERIQQEEAQLQISKVTLERELQEVRLQRQIELEKAQIEAKSQEIQKEVVDEKVLKLRALQIQQEWVSKWNGQLPEIVVASDASGGILLNLPAKK